MSVKTIDIGVRTLINISLSELTRYLRVLGYLLRTDLLAIYLLSTSKKSISVPQLAKFLGITEKTAWFILQRLRDGFKHPNFINDMLGGELEIDETFIGGKNGNRH